MPIYLSKGPSKYYRIWAESLYLTCRPYNDVFVAKIKLFPVRQYHSMGNSWELPLSSLALILANFKDLVIESKDLDIGTQLKFGSLEGYEKYLSTLEVAVPFQFKTKPDPHQIEWFNLMLGRKRVINGDVMGLGKTKEYLDVCEYRRLNEGYKKVLFICKSKHKSNMAKEIEKHTDSKYLIVKGDREHRLEILRDSYRSDDAYYLIIGYESAVLHINELRIIAEDIGFDAVILDEFNKLRNFGSRTKNKTGRKHLTIAIVDLIEYIDPDLIIEGSGTPMTKESEDLYAPLRIAGIEKRSIREFRNTYCQMNSFGQVVGAKNQESLAEVLSSVMIRRTEAILHLPEPRMIYTPVEMDDAQTKLYIACKLNLRKELAGTKAYSAGQFAKLTKLREITTDPALVGADAPSAKMDYVLESAIEAMDNGAKVIIYSMYVATVKKVVDLLAEYNPAMIIGSMSDKSAMDQVNRFQEDQSCRVFVGSLMACMESYTLTEATYEFFIDESWTITDNQQAAARAYRRGQRKTVYMYYPYCPGTVDEIVMGIHAEDSALIDEVVEGRTVRATKELVDKILA